MAGSSSLRLGAAALVAVQALIFGVDAFVALDVVLAPIAAVPVVLFALIAGPRLTLAFGVATVALVLATGVVDDTFLTWQHVIRVVALAVVGAIAVAGAAGRRRLEADVARLALLAAVGDMAIAGNSARRTAEGVLRAIVPRYADGGRITVSEGIDEDGTTVAHGVAGSGRSELDLPLRVPGHELGTLRLVRGAARPRFTRADERFGVALADRTALLLENARLLTGLRTAEAEQRRVAQALQHSLLPPALPEVGGGELASFYRAVGDGTAVGGDFYDAYPLGEGWLLVIGDVAGKGAAAASVTALARGALEAAATETGSARDAIARLDGLLGRRSEVSLCSVACVHLLPAHDGLRAEVLLAGHPPVLLVRDATVRGLGHPGPLPGAFPGSTWRSETVMLRDGDALVLRTDGVTDSVGADGRLGEERLRDALTGGQAASAQEMVDRVRHVVQEHTVGAQRDDVAVLVFAVGSGSHTVHVDLDGTPECVAVARRTVEKHLGSEVGTHVLDDLRLLVSELATNAVRHGDGGPARLTLRWDRRVVTVMVVDTGGGFVPPESIATADGSEDLAPGGHGLALVARLADRWGVDADGGTRVWFEFDRRR